MEGVMSDQQEQIDYSGFRDGSETEVCSRRPLPRSLLIDGEAQPCCVREHRDG